MNSGAFGEEWVAWYLQKKGWEILERNYHSRYGEIDMIAVDGPYIVFVEVKTPLGGFDRRPAGSRDAGQAETAHTHGAGLFAGA